MKIIPIDREKWVGSFTYLDAQDDQLIATEVPFEMLVQIKDGKIRGERIDDESKVLFNKPITLQGTVSKDAIHFVVMYPGRYFANEHCELTVDYDDKYPGCIYSGTWNAEERKYEGKWAIDTSGKETTNSDVVYSSGVWEMRRVEV